MTPVTAHLTRLVQERDSKQADIQLMLASLQPWAQRQFEIERDAYFSVFPEEVAKPTRFTPIFARVSTVEAEVSEHGECIGWEMDQFGFKEYDIYRAPLHLLPTTTAEELAGYKEGLVSKHTADRVAREQRAEADRTTRIVALQAQLDQLRAVGE